MVLECNQRQISQLRRIGRRSERRYQLNAARRNEAIIKFDHNLETARYFERECNKAKQFNAWSIAQSAESKNFEVLKKAESLQSRRSRLKDLLEKEEESYVIECERVKTAKVTITENHSASSILEKKAEDSLYRPLNRSRIQSHFCESFGAYQDYARPVLKDINERNGRQHGSSRLSMESTNLRQENEHQTEHARATRDEDHSVSDNNKNNQKNYNERMDEYKENWRSARASTINEHQVDSGDKERITYSAKSIHRDAAGLRTIDGRSRTRTLHDSHFVLGNESDHEVPSGNHIPAVDNSHYGYATEDVEATNLTEDAKESIEEPSNGEFEDEQNGQIENDETDRAHEKVENDIESEEIAGEGSLDSPSTKAPLNPQQIEEQEEQRQQSEAQMISDQREHDEDVRADSSADTFDHRHFESEKSLPWMRMIPGDKNLSEQMFVYLTHNELKKEIQKLESREKLACSKHNWDEALRLRDMRNRLDIVREKNLYRRDDLLLDPAVKKLGLSRIHAREKLLKDREETCANSSLYSEEAKVMWEHWVVEDENTDVEDARLQREDLMKHLEENWRSLAIEDKQKISDSFHDKHLVNSTLQNYEDNSCSFVAANR